MFELEGEFLVYYAEELGWRLFQDLGIGYLLADDISHILFDLELDLFYEIFPELFIGLAS